MTPARPLNVGLVQMAMGADPHDNLTRAIAGVREAADRSAAGVVPASAEAIVRQVRRALSDGDALSGRRRQIASQLFYRPGTATARAVQCFYDALQLPQPAATPTTVVSPLEMRSIDRA